MIKKEDLKLFNYKGNLHLLVHDDMYSAFRGSLPSAELVEEAVKCGGVYTLIDLKTNEQRYVFKNNKKLKPIKITSKLYKKVCRALGWWEEEFDMEYTDTHRFLVESDSVLQPGDDLFERFGLIGKIRIKARKGKITIEKIK